MKHAIGLSLATGLLTIATPVLANSGCGLDVNPARLDSNNNAELSRSETNGTVLAGVFDRVDTNGDGVISQMEFVNRCASLQASNKNGWGKGWGDTVAGKKAERQESRQKSRVNNRVDSETDKAADSMVDKAMGAIFGD